MSRPYAITMGGEAGYGIMSAGLTLAKIATRSGYQTFIYSEYPSIIRGGHNVTTVTISPDTIRSQYQYIDILIALNQETIDQHSEALAPGSAILYDSTKNISIKKTKKQRRLFDIPLDTLAREIGGSIIMRNTVALGAVLALLNGNIDILHTLIDEEFADKKPDIAEKNKRTATAGYRYVRQHYRNLIQPILSPKKTRALPIVVNGNEATALGAIAGGMQFTAIYPMTPTSNILHILAPLQEKYQYIYEQPEDEIAAINMAIGASFAGARSMVATAGGGFCLMSEGYGLAAMIETPLVVIVGMRGGPATGLPTWTEQADLRFVLHAHQGDFPRIVLAAGDIEEAFELTAQAFYLADKYQTPVVLLVDKYLCESTMSVPSFSINKKWLDRGKILLKKKKNYERYHLSRDGISLRTIPGIGNYTIANSDEHDEMGFSKETACNRTAQMNKRMQKLATCAAKDMAEPTLYGPKNADVTIVSWGSNKGPILEAMREHVHVNYLHLTWMNPFPKNVVKKILRNAKKIITVECSISGQLTGLIREQTGIEITNQLLKYTGRPFYPEEIQKMIQQSR